MTLSEAQKEAMKLDRQDNLIHRYFRTTTDWYDDLEWDGKVLYVCLEGATIETYTYADLVEIIPDFNFSDSEYLNS